MLAAVCLAGCASGPTRNPADPLEPLNRKVDSFNNAVDKAVIRPVAVAYRDHVPELVRTGVTNFFNNLGDVWNFVNSVLQLQAQDSAQTFMRVNVNTVFGLGGLLDVATDLGIQRHPEDLGETLGYWGVPPGPYIVLPFLGPSTLRDTVALPADYYYGGMISRVVHDVPVRNSLYVVNVVDRRAKLLPVESMVDGLALDKYSFMRDAWLQKRRSDVYHGNPPESPASPGHGPDDGRLPDPESQNGPDSPIIQGSQDSAPQDHSSAPEAPASQTSFSMGPAVAPQAGTGPASGPGKADDVADNVIVIGEIVNP